jgi:PIN domain nuclease of toxin-antitoxin system
MGMPEIVVLDTHIWIWLINANFDRFPTSWLSVFERADRLGVSPLSCYEIALAQQRGRLELDCGADEWFEKALFPASIELFPLTTAIAIRSVTLSPIHKDPFDRLIMATALEYNAKLDSVDGLFFQYSELADFLLELKSPV